MKKLPILLMTICFLLFGSALTGVSAEGKSRFIDVPSGHWAAASIDTMVKLGVIHGRNELHYVPDADVTRGEYVQLLMNYGYQTKVMLPRYYIKAPTAPYTDITIGDWYYDAAVDAYNRGIGIGAQRDHFYPNQALTREDMAVITAQFYNHISGEVKAPARELPPLSFGDAEEITKQNKPAIAQLQDLGILSGKRTVDNQLIFDPKSHLTRAAAAAILTRLYNKSLLDMNDKAGDYVVLTENGITFTITRSTDRLHIIADMGEKATGGYAVHIQGITIDQSVIMIAYSMHTPKPGDIVTQAFTHPMDEYEAKVEASIPYTYKLKQSLDK
jgi:hypothetical protein